MADERHNFAQARARLEEIVVQVRKKDTSLEKSLDLLEEGVRLANVCTELSDHTEWRAVAEEQRADSERAGAESTDAESADDSGVTADGPPVQGDQESPDAAPPADGGPSAR